MITNLFNKFRFRKPIKISDPNKIVGVLMGWDLKPHIAHEDGTYFPTIVERMRYPEYFVFGDGEWPTDPITKEKLPIADPRS